MALHQVRPMVKKDVGHVTEMGNVTIVMALVSNLSMGKRIVPLATEMGYATNVGEKVLWITTKIPTISNC